MEASVLGMVVQKRLSEEREIFELRPGEKELTLKNLGWSVPGRMNSTCKGSQEGRAGLIGGTGRRPCGKGVSQEEGANG